MMAWIYFAVVQLVALIATLVGWVILIPLSATRCWIMRESRYFPGRQIEVWRGGWLTWIWGNEEDSVIGNAEHRARFKDDRLGAYFWSAWRNSANNLRFIFRWQGGPFWRREFGKWYVQAGWYPNGYPVISAGRI